MRTPHEMCACKGGGVMFHNLRPLNKNKTQTPEQMSSASHAPSLALTHSRPHRRPSNSCNIAALLIAKRTRRTCRSPPISAVTNSVYKDNRGARPVPRPRAWYLHDLLTTDWRHASASASWAWWREHLGTEAALAFKRICRRRGGRPHGTKTLPNCGTSCCSALPKECYDEITL